MSFTLLKPETWDMLRNPETDAQNLKSVIDQIWDTLPYADMDFKYGKHGFDKIMERGDETEFNKFDIHIQTVDNELAEARDQIYGVIGQWYAQTSSGFAVFNGFNIARKWIDVIVFYSTFYGSSPSEDTIKQRNGFQMMGQEHWKVM